MRIAGMVWIQLLSASRTTGFSLSLKPESEASHSHFMMGGLEAIAAYANCDFVQALLGESGASVQGPCLDLL